MPFALDLVRKLHAGGHEVYASDTFASAGGSHSGALAGHFVTASAEHATEQFIDDVEKIVRDHGIEMVLPAFEEAFYLATAHDRLDPITTLYTGPFSDLARLHDKGTFQRLAVELGLPAPETVVARSDADLADAIARWPRWFARAAFSRGGVALLTNTGPLADRMKPEDVHPSDDEPWLVQPFVDGPMNCTYSTLHDGHVTAHCTYAAPRQWHHSTGIEFEAIDGGPSLAIIETLGRHLGYTGQLSFDFVDRGEAGLTLIECNPRPTDGVLLMSPEQLVDGLMNPEQETTMVEPGKLVELSFAVFASMFGDGVRNIPSSIHDLLHVKDPNSGWHDHLPTLYSALSLAHHAKVGWREHKGLFEAMADDMSWDGDPIEGMSAADRRVLDELESTAASG